MNYIYLALILFAYMNLWFVLSVLIKRNDIADIAWGLGFVLLAWSSFYFGGGFEIQSILINILVTIWGLRLAYHIGLRNLKKSEDSRYKAWRDDWGKWVYLRSYFQIYLLQGFFLYVISLSFVYINLNSNSDFDIFLILGTFVWAVGFYFEARGDFELSEFIKNPANKGKIMTQGLWKYTRHPNYFGEVTMWWGIFFMALSSSGSLFTILSPLTITFLILYVSGIPMLEKKYEGRKDFEEYKKKTAAFFPWFPKKN